MKSSYAARVVLTAFSAAAYCLIVHAASAAEPCDKIAPSQSATENYNTIKQCLASSDGIAKLDEGLFRISQKITMPPKSKLFGASKETSVIAPAEPAPRLERQAAGQAYPNNVILETTNDNVVDRLALTGNGRLHEDCCTSVVAITGSRSRLTNLEIYDLDPITKRARTEAERGKSVGIYFIGPPQSDKNIVDHSVIHDVLLGVVFRAGLPRDNSNVISNSDMHNIYCDAITFAGYGISDHNIIDESGFACRQTPKPIPGAGIYSVNNHDGGKVTHNVITNICGNGFDFDNAGKFELRDNTIVLTGGASINRYEYCGAGSPGVFVGIKNFVVKDNYFMAIELIPLGAFLGWFPAYEADTRVSYDPLPNRQNKIMAVRILNNKHETTSNVFDNNVMLARCTKTEICEGVGLYTGPGTGSDSSGDIKETPQLNTFTRNKLNMSNIGSLRCGRNSYAADSICAYGAGGNISCNDDDFQHVAGKNSDRFRNDRCLSR